MSSAEKPVPRLDLAPKLNRSLSLKNPLDYLRVFYWFFFFPQALRIFEGQISKLIVIGFSIIGFVLYLTNFIQFYYFNINLSVEVLIGFLIFSFICGIIKGIQFKSLKFNKKVLIGFVSGFIVLISLLILLNPSIFISVFIIKLKLIPQFLLTILIKLDKDITNYNLLFILVFCGILFGTSLGFLFPIKLIKISSLCKDWIDNSLVGIRIYLSLLIIRVLMEIFVLNIDNPNPDYSDFFLYCARGGIFFFFWSFGTVIVNSRILEWLVSSILNTSRFSNNLKCTWFIRITPIPILNLNRKVKKWLLADWDIGLHNANQLLEYTFQYHCVIQGISQALCELPQEHIVFRTSQLAESPYHWELIRCISHELYKKSGTKNINDLINTPLANSILAAITTEGFWYLYQSTDQAEIKKDLTIEYLQKALDAFQKVRFLPYGDEIFLSTQTLKECINADELAAISYLNIDTIFSQPMLRKATCEVIISLQKVIKEVKIIQISVSKSTKSYALNRAFGELKTIQDDLDSLPDAEKYIVKYIVENWKNSLDKIASKIGEVSIPKTLLNPYIIGDPVQGMLFVGREEIMRQLEEVWISKQELQSVVIFGHRRMGKTSILRNISTRLDEKVKLAYVNLLTVGDHIEGVWEVLMAIADSLSDTLQIPPPDDDSLINLPYRTFERYLKQIETQLGDTGLIIALDEFEQIEELIKSDRIPKDFMAVLRGMVQMSPKIAFALAGLHTLEEMTEDYFNPFFASIIPIRVSFLERATCRYLLANPSEDFPLDYKPDALDYIYDLTAGQPYLVQLIGFLLVRRYNDQVFELGNNRDPMFTIADVDGIINQPEFYQNGRYYFTGVWQQAGEGSPGQQQIIKAIAPHPTGLDFNTLQTVTNLDPISLQNALDTLARHDVIQEIDHHWRIIVELFRRWVVSHQNN